jgi:succinate dehydrogenase / fumarate reductase membrane anchor subunit
MQRVTAIANIPLTIAVGIIIVSLIGADHATVVARLGNPVIVMIMLGFVLSMTWHMRLGLQVVIEDYVRSEGRKIACLLGNTFFCIAVAIASVYAILKLGFGA